MTLREEHRLRVFMEDIPLCSKLYRNIVKPAPSKHNFITML